MFSQPVSSSLPSETDAARAARQLAMLRALAEMGLELARLAKDDAVRQAEAANSPVPPVEKRPDAKAAFVRLANGVRQAIAMERRIATGAPEPAPRRADPRRKAVSAALLEHVAARAGVDELPAMAARADRLLDEMLDADAEQALTAADVFIRVASRDRVSGAARRVAGRAARRAAGRCWPDRAGEG